MDGTSLVGDQDGQMSPERSVPPVSLRSVQQYRSQDEYIVVMKEDLAEWFNELYGTTMTADDLFDRLDTGILLCRYACLVDDVISRSRDIRSEPVVYRERAVEAGSFQARVNVAAFLAWCRRRPLQMPDDVLFETGDLICQRPTERNERQVALSLLEVGRRSAALRVGLPAPQLVRLEAEIDAEMRADVGTETTTTSGRQTDDSDEYNKQESQSNASQSSVNDFTSPSAVHKTRRIRPPSVNVSHNFSNSSMERQTVSDVNDDVNSSVETVQSEKRGSAWQRRRYRPTIPVDMMSLDEMVREILSRCTCPIQYPMIRVSEGKYRVGDNLTLIFVRILRQHVMVRIGGGWNTLDNYLARCDPCRCQKNSAYVSVFPTTVSPTSTVPVGTSTVSGDDDVRQPQRAELSSKSLNGHRRTSSTDLPPSPVSPMTSSVTTSGRQQPVLRRLSDLSMTSQVLPVDNASSDGSFSSSATAHYSVAMTTKAGDVTPDSAADRSGSNCRDNDSSVTAGLVHSTSSPRMSGHHSAILTSTSSSPYLAAAVPVQESCSCPRLQGDLQRKTSTGSRTPSSRPSRIPVPLRLAAQSRSQNVTFFLGGAVNSPRSRQTYATRHRRCDSGVDLNLSSPDFD